MFSVLEILQECKNVLHVKSICAIYIIFDVHVSKAKQLCHGLLACVMASMCCVVVRGVCLRKLGILTHMEDHCREHFMCKEL